jgi:hypothetical protein
MRSTTLERTTIIDGVRYVNVHKLAALTGYSVCHLQERSRENGRGYMIPSIRSIEFGYRGKPALWYREDIATRLKNEREASLLRNV